MLAARTLQGAWEAGPVAHLLATASHQRILLKASFQAPLAKAPRLRAGKRVIPGVKTDTAGLFWQLSLTPPIFPPSQQKLALRKWSVVHLHFKMR